MTNQDKIKNYLSITRCGEWVMEGKIRGIDTDFGWIGFRGDRDVRQMVKEGKLEKRMNGKYAEVRAKGLGIVDMINAIPPRKAEIKFDNSNKLI